jgi:hypothetical protein
MKFLKRKRKRKKEQQMSFIEKPLDDVTEPSYGPEGIYDLVIEKADAKMDGETRKNMLLIIKIEKAPAGLNPEELANVLHNFSFIVPEDDEQKANNKQIFGKKFCHLFNINTKGKRLSDLAAMDFIGKRAKGVQMKVKEYEGKKSNVIVFPSLPQAKK